MTARASSDPLTGLGPLRKPQAMAWIPHKLLLGSFLRTGDHLTLWNIITLLPQCPPPPFNLSLTPALAFDPNPPGLCLSRTGHVQVSPVFQGRNTHTKVPVILQIAADKRSTNFCHAMVPLYAMASPLFQGFSKDNTGRSRGGESLKKK